ncbi:MAG TPA: RsmE family RNA methyltransferase [Candidatus Binataceae bacterium]|nr:RsmE family RNA methyltransferase [Candidatus Binataceae bacterium]
MIDGAELHHLRDVMRLRVGDAVALLAQNNFEHLARIERFEEARAILRIEKTITTPQAASLILASAIIKGPRMDFLVEKAAELGVTELWPMLCERGVATMPGAERMARWRRLATAAAKQSLAPAALKMHEPTPLAGLIETLATDTLAGRDALKLICAMGAEPIGSVIQRARPRAIVIACGPEGDFTDAEMELATRAGFVRVGLGRNRLRSETAALAAVSVARAMLDEFGQGED